MGVERQFGNEIVNCTSTEPSAMALHDLNAALVDQPGSPAFERVSALYGSNSTSDLFGLDWSGFDTQIHSRAILHLSNPGAL